MAITKLNSLAIPDDTIVEADLSYPLTNFSSTGIDDNADATCITISSAENVGVGAAPDTTGFGGTFKYLGVNGGSGYGVFNGQTSSTTTNDAAASFFGSTTGSSGYKLLGGVQVINNAGSSSNAEGALTFFTSTGGSIAEQMRIDRLGNVGIGTNSSWFTATGRRILRVQGGANGSFLVLDTSGSGDFYIESSNSGRVNHWNQANEAMVFATNNTERMRILASGGLTFNGDTSSANALDDYEEGSWTIAAGASIGTISTQRSRLYTKIGRLVNIRIEFTVPSNSNGAQAFFTGLPFNSSNLDVYRDVGAASTTGLSLVTYQLNNSSTFYIYSDSFGAISFAQLSGKTVTCNFTYLAS